MLAATEQSDWITGINTDVPDVVSFVVTANDTQQEREGSVVLSYEYHKEGTPAMDLSVAVLEVTVLQEAGQAGQKPDPNPDYSDAFTVEVSEITATSARIAASCKYPELYWTVDVPAELFSRGSTATSVSPDEHDEYACSKSMHGTSSAPGNIFAAAVAEKAPGTPAYATLSPFITLSWKRLDRAMRFFSKFT